MPKRPIPLSFILLAAVVVHLPLLLAKLPLHSYDATFHIFFASHYLHHWMDPWNVKWYAGFSQTTYPPLPQQWVAVLSHIFGLEMAQDAGLPDSGVKLAPVRKRAAKKTAVAAARNKKRV